MNTNVRKPEVLLVVHTLGLISWSLWTLGQTLWVGGCTKQAEPQEPACLENEKRCLLENSQTCLSGLWRQGTDCARLEQQCRKGECQPYRICEEDGLQCDENFIERCTSRIWTRIQDCGLTQQLCLAGECKDPCNTQQGRCQENFLEKCENGLWVHDRDCTNLGQVCQDGACQPMPECEGSIRRCVLNRLEECQQERFQLLVDCSQMNQICREESCREKPIDVSLRPFESDQGHLRYLDLRMASNQASKVCIFGADGDVRPYQVAYSRSLVPGNNVVIQEARYDFWLPKEIELWAHWLDQAPLSPGTSEPTTEGCDLDQATLLVLPGQIKEADDWHTLVLAGFSAPNKACSSCCQDQPDFKCAFFPRSHSAHPVADCPSSSLYVLHDGILYSDGWDQGYRGINLSNNAQWLSLNTKEHGGLTHLYHLTFLMPGTVLPYHSYTPQGWMDPLDPSNTQTRVRLCPHFLECLVELDPSFTYWTLLETLWTCPEGNEDWIVAETITDRLKQERIFTTFYLVGHVGPPDEGYTKLHPAEVTLVVAHDVADEPLP